MKIINIEFPGGVKVDAKYKEYTMKTDQPESSGGEDSAPSPFDLFLGSLATCAGFYALAFCNSKDIPTQGMNLSMEMEKDKDTNLVGKINFNLKLPEDFPMKYKNAIIKSMESCTVKKHLENPPEFEIFTEE